MLRRKAIFAFGLASVVTVLCLPVADAQTHNAATEEQQQTQEEVAERARALLDRFTNRQPEQPTETTSVPMEEAPMEETFDPGPVETFTEAQNLEEPVDYLPDSGFGLSITGIALGLTTLKHHKRIAKHLEKFQKTTA